LTTDAAGDLSVPIAPLSISTRWRILLYLGGLVVLLGLGSPTGGLIGLPISFFLKNKLHLKAHEVAVFGLYTHIPLYVAFGFGFIRDTWSPFGLRDRGYMRLFGSLGAVTCLVFAFIPTTYGALLAGVLLLMVSFLFLEAALQGLTSTIGRQHQMSGQLSSAWKTFAALPAIGALLAGGALSDLLEGQQGGRGARVLFLVAGAIMAAVALYGLWKPASVFENVHSERLAGSSPLDDLKRLSRHWPVYPALAIWLLWNFVPGFGTPLQYFLQNTLHASDTQTGQWRALYVFGALPGFLAFGWLCRRFSLKSLLMWSTLVATPMMFPLIFMHQVVWALMAAAPMGFLAGFASVAYVALIFRACPPGLQGTVLMAAAGLLAVDSQFGDLLGASLFDHFHNFDVCVIAMTVTNLMIVPVLLIVPSNLVSQADGA
jgi:Na+/melibiose symporter-like transporter